MKVYTGDLLPDLTITCLDDTTPVDLTTAEAIRVHAQQDGVLLFDRAATGNASGVVVVAWQAGDTATAGQIFVEVEVTWPGAKPQTFRAQEAIEVVESFA